MSGTSMTRTEDFAAGVVATILVVVALIVAYRLGGISERQSRDAVACEPRCIFTYQNKRLINVQCPDSTGRLAP